MSKRLVFKRTMMQRYRAIAHFIDPIIKNGYELWIEVQEDKNKFDIKRFLDRPMNASKASKGSVKHLIDNFNIPYKYFDKVNFTTLKNKIDGFYLTLDKKIYNKDFVALPYNDFYCRHGKDKYKVGNPMCNLFDKYQSEIDEEKGSLLLIHPGGGRGYVSPVREFLDEKKTRRNNMYFMESIFNNIPDCIKKITIKTHPVPYLCCHKRGIEKTLNIMNVSKYNFLIHISDQNLMKNIASHEFILNIGSSTTIWLLGSEKKWINICGMAKYSYEKHRDHRERTKKWFDWPQHTKLNKLSNLILNYDDIVLESKKALKIREKYKELRKLNAIKNCMKIIKKCI